MIISALAANAYIILASIPQYAVDVAQHSKK